jgi:hypothetical protein
VGLVVNAPAPAPASDEHCASRQLDSARISSTTVVIVFVFFSGTNSGAILPRCLVQWYCTSLQSSRSLKRPSSSEETKKNSTLVSIVCSGLERVIVVLDSGTLPGRFFIEKYRVQNTDSRNSLARGTIYAGASTCASRRGPRLHTTAPEFFNCRPAYKRVRNYLSCHAGIGDIVERYSHPLDVGSAHF